MSVDYGSLHRQIMDLDSSIRLATICTNEGKIMHSDHREGVIDLVNSVVNELLLLLPNDKALVRIDKLGIVDSIIKSSQNWAEVKIICPVSKENSQIRKKIVDNAPDINIFQHQFSAWNVYC
jgi:hypothetical protein